MKGMWVLLALLLLPQAYALGYVNATVNNTYLAIANVNPPTGLPALTVMGGNVGLGTLNPQNKLHIVGPEGLTGTYAALGPRDILVLENNNNANMDFIACPTCQSRIRFGSNSSVGLNPGYIMYEQNIQALTMAANSTVNLQTNSSTRVTVDGLGNLGIGTTVLNQKLNVNGTSNFTNGNIWLDNAIGSTTGNLYFGGNTAIGQVGMRLFGGNVNGVMTAGFIDVTTNITTDGLRFRVDTANGGTERMRITAAGNVGIGTTAPNNKLNVIGDGNFTANLYVGTLTAASATTVCRDANNALSTCSSSRIFKSNIQYLSDSDYQKILSDITNTKVATFSYKTDHPNMTRYGIIAEEAPKPLQYIDEHGNNNLDFYSAQLGYTWAGIKALKAQNDQLKAELTQLQARVDKLESK